MELGIPLILTVVTVLPIVGLVGYSFPKNAEFGDVMFLRTVPAAGGKVNETNFLGAFLSLITSIAEGSENIANKTTPLKAEMTKMWKDIVVNTAGCPDFVVFQNDFIWRRDPPDGEYLGRAAGEVNSFLKDMVEAQGDAEDARDSVEDLSIEDYDVYRSMY